MTKSDKTLHNYIYFSSLYFSAQNNKQVGVQFHRAFYGVFTRGDRRGDPRVNTVFSQSKLRAVELNS